MASFKKFKIGNTSYDVKDANAGYSIDTNGAAIFLKNSDGTIISSISAPSGMDYDIIADEFGVNVPSHPTIYSQYDIVTNNGYYYYSNINNNTDTLDVPASWHPTNSQSASYVSDGNFCVVNNEYYLNLSGGSQNWDPDHWADMGFVKADYKGAWSAGSTGYAVGDYCIYLNDLYRCTGATTGQSWDSTKWTQVQIMDEIPSSIVNSVTVNPIYTSGTPIAQISVTDSNGTQGYTLVAPSGASPIILDLNTNDNLNQIEQNPPSGYINLVTPITITDLETAIANGVPCYITTKVNHAIRNTLTKYNTLNYEFSYIGWTNGSQRPLSVTLNVSGGTASSVRIS